MKNDLSERKNVVLLVDNKHRDLMVATLIAHQLEETGVICHLEPLEAWRGVLAAYRPSMIIFNHINATHLVQYSKRLAEMGVKTAVLPNEGILYDPEVLNYNAGKHHNGAHIDMFFCWNQVHKDALLRCGFDQNTQIEVVGVPRFDYYFAPWSGIFDVQKRTPQGRPRLLFCTNFGFAKYYDLPKATAEEFMREYTCVSSYKDFWDLIETNHQCQQRFFDYITAAVAADRFDITLRPHPNEKLSVYQQWLDKLKPEWRGRVRLDRETHITQAILNCDLEISCETCTTAMESWIAGKPTVELVLKKHPVFYHKFHAGLNVACEKPEDLPRIVEEELAHPRQEAQRAEHFTGLV